MKCFELNTILYAMHIFMKLLKICSYSIIQCIRVFDLIVIIQCNSVFLRINLIFFFICV